MLHFIHTLQQAIRRAGRSLSGTRRQRSLHHIDALEPRTLLASLVSATKLSYQDTDGDNVTVTLSKPVLTAGNVNSIFTFDTGTVDGSLTTKQQLRSINLGGVLGVAGTTITTAAVRSATTGGDGFAALGQIIASAIDIGAVTIDGDLGRIVAGDATLTTQGLGALKVHSMGRYGTLTGATNLNTVIQGKLVSLTTKSDVKDAFIDVQGGANGQIGSVTIAGSLIGGNNENSGRILSAGDMGAVKVTGNVQGGAALRSGNIRAYGKLATVTISGSLIGGTGDESGVIAGDVDAGAVKITNDVQGGAGSESGSVTSGGKLVSVTIGGGLIGAAGVYSGVIIADGDMGPVNITGDVQGGAGYLSGTIETYGKLASATIGGSLIGGTGEYSGEVAADGDTGAVKVIGDIQGGAGYLSGALDVYGKLASATIGGSLIGGTGSGSGIIYSDLDTGSVNVTGDVRGGASYRSGSISSNGKLASVTIGGSLIGGSASEGGSIITSREITTLTIGGNIRGGSASGAETLEASGSVQAGRIGTLTLNGSLIAGTDNTSGLFRNNGAIRVVNDIANLTIKGSVIGNSTSNALITARGQITPVGTTDLAIGKLTINGRVEYGLIVAGSSAEPAVTSSNADAQIGPVVIGGDWIASSLAAGASAGVDAYFGNSNDAKMSGVGVKDFPTVSSKITSIVIGGQVLGTVGGIDHFGFVAENIGSFKVKGGTTTYTLIAGNSNDDILLSLNSLFSGDTRLNEI